MTRCAGADDSVRPFCNALPRFRRGRRPVPFPCHSVGDGVLDVPSARQRRAGNGLPRRFAPRNDKVRRGGRLCPSRIPAAKKHLPPRPVPAAQKSDRQAPVTWFYRWNCCLYSSKYWAKEWDFMARTLDRYSWVSKESDSSSMMATATLEQWSATRS